MSIATELSCDVATALLSPKGDEDEAAEGDLTSIVLEVHSTLRQLTEGSRRRRRDQILSAAAGQASASDGRGAGH